MRVWFIDPGYLDNKRLVAAHNEVHACRTCVINGVRWTNFPTLLGRSLHYAKAVHDGTLAELAVRKGGTPTEVQDLTPFVVDGLPPHFTDTDFRPTEDQIVQDVKDLRNKWTAEGYYYGVGRLDLRELERQYKLKEGPSLEEAEKIENCMRAVVKEYHGWFSEYRNKHPRSRMQDRIQAFLAAHGKIPMPQPKVKPERLPKKAQRHFVLEILGIR